MNYEIHLVVKSELDEIVCELSTTAGITDLEENLIRKAESAISQYEDTKEKEAELANELAEEEREEAEGPNHYGIRN